MQRIKFFFKLLNSWARGKEPIYNIYLRGKRALDLGCGPTSIILKDKQNFYGVDINEMVVERLKSQNYNVFLESVTKTHFEDNFFDVVHSSNVIEHLDPENARSMIIEGKRILKHEGRMIIISPMPKTVWNTFGHIKPYPPQSIKKLFRDDSYESFESVKGLEIENVFYYGAWGTNKITFLISTIYSNIFPCLAGSYLLILRKYK